MSPSKNVISLFPLRCGARLLDVLTAAALFAAVPLHAHPLTCQLQYTSDLAGGTWEGVGSPASGTGDEIAFSINLHPGTLQGFYRILIQR